MNGAQVLAEVLRRAVEQGPEVARGVAAIAQSLRSEHPELRPPREDEEAAVDARVDAMLRQRANDENDEG